VLSSRGSLNQPVRVPPPASVVRADGRPAPLQTLAHGRANEQQQ
jgi:hypothetical protein